MNVEFVYLYRDCGNNKNFGSVVFSNRNNLSIQEISEQALGAVGGEKAINSAELGIPDLFFKDYPFDPELDHELHEFLEISETQAPENDRAKRDISEFLPTLIACRLLS